MRWSLMFCGLMCSAAVNGAVLGPGYTLESGQRLYSADGRFYAELRGDGDFTVIRSADGARSWATHTKGSGAVRASMQRDGRLLLQTTSGQTVWSSPTRGRHRVFGVTTWGTAIIVNARKWKPRRKRAEPIVERMLRRHAFIDWQSTAFDRPPKFRQR